MKIIIGTPFERNGKVLPAESVHEDFTEDELKKYSGLYRTESNSAKDVETKIKEKSKKEITDKNLKINKV
mgnify:CR=1 FL=1